MVAKAIYLAVMHFPWHEGYNDKEIKWEGNMINETQEAPGLGGSRKGSLSLNKESAVIYLHWPTGYLGHKGIHGAG
jgi:hypothetical protein